MWLPGRLPIPGSALSRQFEPRNPLPVSRDLQRQVDRIRGRVRRRPAVMLSLESQPFPEAVGGPAWRHRAVLAEVEQPGQC